MKLKREGSAELGARIRQKRQESGRTLTAVAEQTGISQSYLSQIERGDVTNPTIEVVFRILEALDQNLLLEASTTRAQPGSDSVYHSPFTLEELAATGKMWFSSFGMCLRTLKSHSSSGGCLASSWRG